MSQLIPSLNIFLDNKPLYYKEIDTKRIGEAYSLLGHHLSFSKVIHIVGTNGKGSTGRIIAHIASEQGLCVGHYTSPHIFHFNERIWLNKEFVSDEVLDIAHKKLFGVLGEKLSSELSYFEYSTLLALVVFQGCDLIVLEAGLGGVDDATNVVLKDLSVITPIGFDHQAFLGDSIEQIATAKLGSIENDFVLAQQPYKEVVSLAQNKAKEKNVILYEPDCVLCDSIKNKVATKNWADFLIDNALVAIKALDAIGIPYDLNDIKNVELFGRFYPILPNVKIDVGHNILAAKAIEKSISSRVVLIYNSLDDKPFEEILSILKPKIKKVLLIPINTSRAVDISLLKRSLGFLDIEYEEFDGVLNEDESYLVFGSFYTIEAFLKGIGYYEK